MRLLPALALLALAAATAATAAAPPFDTSRAPAPGERLENAALAKSLELQLAAWTAAFGGNTKLLAAQFSPDVVFCNAVMPECPSGAEVLKLIDHFVAAMRGGTLRATFVRYGTNEYEFGWQAAYACASGAVEAASGSLHIVLDPRSGRIVRAHDLWDAAPFLEAMARCAGGDGAAPEPVEGAMNPDHLAALLDSDIASYNTFFEAVSPRGARPPFAHLDDAVTYCRLGGCGTGRLGFLGELATYRGRIAHLRVTPLLTQIGVASASARYFSVIQCRNGYLFSLDGTLALYVDPASRKVTRHLDLVDRAEFVTHFSRCK